MKKTILILVMTIAGIFTIQAQNYNTAIGIRGILGGDVGGGLSVKHFVGESTALEGIASFRQDGVLITGLYEPHRDINNADGLSWFYGFGGHVGFYDDNDNNPFDEKTIIGVDGILGLDYIFNFPLNISLDWKPFINLVGGGGFIGDAGNFTARYAF